MGRLGIRSLIIQSLWDGTAKKCFKWDCVISFVPYNRRSNDYQLMGSAE